MPSKRLLSVNAAPPDDGSVASEEQRKLQAAQQGAAAPAGATPVGAGIGAASYAEAALRGSAQRLATPAPGAGTRAEAQPPPSGGTVSRSQSFEELRGLLAGLTTGMQELVKGQRATEDRLARLEDGSDDGRSSAGGGSAPAPAGAPASDSEDDYSLSG